MLSEERAKKNLRSLFLLLDSAKVLPNGELFYQTQLTTTNIGHIGELRRLQTELREFCKEEDEHSKEGS